MRKQDIVTRNGGDEFVVVQVGVGGYADIESLVRRLLDAMTDPFDVMGDEVRLGCSIGISLAADSHGGCAELLRDADAALYKAKSIRPGDYSFHKPSSVAELGSLFLARFSPNRCEP